MLARIGNEEVLLVLSQVIEDLVRGMTLLLNKFIILMFYTILIFDNVIIEVGYCLKYLPWLM